MTRRSIWLAGYYTAILGTIYSVAKLALALLG